MVGSGGIAPLAQLPILYQGNVFIYRQPGHFPKITSGNSPCIQTRNQHVLYVLSLSETLGNYKMQRLGRR